MVRCAVSWSKSNEDAGAKRAEVLDLSLRLPMTRWSDASSYLRF